MIAVWVASPEAASAQSASRPAQQRLRAASESRYRSTPSKPRGQRSRLVRSATRPQPRLRARVWPSRVLLHGIRVPPEAGRRRIAPILHAAGRSSSRITARRGLASGAAAPMLGACLGGSGVGRAEIAAKRNPSNLNRIMPAEGRRGCDPHIGASPSPRGGEHATDAVALRGAARRAGGGAGEAGARHLHLRELRLGMGAGAGDRRELRGGLRLHGALRRRRRRGGADRAAEARGRAHAGRRRPRARHQPDGAGQGRRAGGAARDRGAGAGAADRVGRRQLPALRLGLLRLRLRHGGDAGAAGELRGADRLGRQRS